MAKVIIKTNKDTAQKIGGTTAHSIKMYYINQSSKDNIQNKSR